MAARTPETAGRGAEAIELSASHPCTGPAHLCEIMLSMGATMDNDTLITIAEKICQLWTACGGYGPPHEFGVVEWGRRTAAIQNEGDLTLSLTPERWCEAHQAVKMGARRGIGTA